MRSIMSKSAMLAGAFLLVAGVAANAAAADELHVKVPFPFVVNGHNFPAGAYSIQRDNASSPVLLIRGEPGTHAAGFVMTRPADGRDPAGSAPVLTFTRDEKQFRLSTVWESRDDGQRVIGR